MFTGIIEEIGTVVAIEKNGKLTISAQKILEDIHLGDSIAVNGICLTASALGQHSFTADVMGETFRRSNLGQLQKGSIVNLERAMAANGRFGGHMVSGHVDGTGTITGVQKENNAVWITVTAKQELLHYMVEKGSIAIDGISLTIAEVTENGFSVSVIPHTGSETTILQKKIGETVNLECDIVGKYIEKWLNKEKIQKKSKITWDFLQQNGF